MDTFERPGLLAFLHGAYSHRRFLFGNGYKIILLNDFTDHFGIEGLLLGIKIETVKQQQEPDDPFQV
jgi:hypothetical protein